MRSESQAGVAPLRRGLPPPRRRVQRLRWLRLARRLCVAAGLLAAVLWLAGSRRFSVQHLAVSGAHRVDPAWALARLEPLRGRPLLTLRWPEALAPLAEHPWLAGLSIHKVLPDTLEVRLEEKHPVALLRQEDALAYLSDDGWPIAPWVAGRGDDLPLLTYRRELPVPVEQVMELLAELREAAPQWEAELSELEVLGEGDALLVTDALPWPVLLRRGRVASGVRRCRALWPALAGGRLAAARLDLRFEDRIILQPGGHPDGDRVDTRDDRGEGARGVG